MSDEQKLVSEILTQGKGDAAKVGDRVSLDYKGTLLNGTQFDASTPGNPFSFKLGSGMVIAGWEIGIKGMQVGETRKLTIPSDLAYGEEGYPGVIPPSATLVFVVTLLAIN